MLSQDAPTITFLNLKILRLQAYSDDILRLLPLLDAPTLRILDLGILDFSLDGFPDVEQFTNRLSTSKFPLLALRIYQIKNAHGLDLFFQLPNIQAIPFVEVHLHRTPSEQATQRQESCVLGGAVWMDHWVVGWNRLSNVSRDLADYLFGKVKFPRSFFGPGPFPFV